jgi:hypothetical protein
MLNIEVHVERISNGFIVTGNDSTKTKRYFPSMEDFVKSEILEAAKEEDRYFREYAADGVEFDIRAVTSPHQSCADDRSKEGTKLE